MNVRVFEELTSGVGLRQIARLLQMDIHSIRNKLRKIARTCEPLHANLCRRLPPNCTYLLDEEETYEQASIRPVTIPVCIERASWFVVAISVGSIRRMAKPGTARRRRQERDELRRGRRRDESRMAVRRVLEQLRRLVPAGRFVLQTDQKSSYGSIAQELFGQRAIHQTTSSRVMRGTFNPLFPINSTFATMRCINGRLRRKSWLVSKLKDWLLLQLWVFLVLRNYVRRRFHRDPPGDSAAKLLGLVPRALRVDEVLAWRQAWGSRSPHPMCTTGRHPVGGCRCG